MTLTRENLAAAAEDLTHRIKLSNNGYVFNHQHTAANGLFSTDLDVVKLYPERFAVSGGGFGAITLR